MEWSSLFQVCFCFVCSSLPCINKFTKTGCIEAWSDALSFTYLHSIEPWNHIHFGFTLILLQAKWVYWEMEYSSFSLSPLLPPLILFQANQMYYYYIQNDVHYFSSYNVFKNNNLLLFLLQLQAKQSPSCCHSLVTKQRHV